VTVICPGIINTNIVQDAKITHVEKMKVDQSQLINFYKNWGWPPERVAKAVLKAVKKNKGIVPVEPEAWLVWYIKRFSQKLWKLYMRLTVKFAY
jgi:short-subunit dehydrogenase